MRKIPTLFVRDPFTQLKYVSTEVHPDCRWVLDGEGVATRKYDGTCVMYDGAHWYARREVKPGKSAPENYRPIETDPNTAKTVGWEPIEQSAYSKWFDEARNRRTDPISWMAGTYELCGPKVNGNPEGFSWHVLVFHEMAEWHSAPRDFDALREWLADFEGEGLVLAPPGRPDGEAEAQGLPRVEAGWRVTGDDFVAPGDPERVAGVLDLIRARADLAGLRVLDLACRTGAFSTALANAGAMVLGIEGRPENFDRIPPSAARYELGDVRDLYAARHGVHDVTLSLGILYHLDAEDAIGLLAAMREVTTGFAVIDTHIGGAAAVTEVAGSSYLGWWYGEPPGLWSSIGNGRSFWFTPDSLDDAIRSAGWVTIEHLPRIEWPGEPAGRHWLVIS